MKKLLLTAASAALLASGQASALSVTATADANVLANEILGSGITVNSVGYTGTATSSGLFTDGLSSGIGIDSGIILTTGTATSAVGPNTSDSTTTDNGMVGSAALNAQIPGYTTYDATILDINFSSTGGDVFFNYVFASEEYNEYVGSSFNDVFAFFIDGVNIAYIPGTTTPVSINNVNCGNPYGSADNYCSEFNNNDPTSGTPTPYNIEYDGFTNVFTASFLGLSAGNHTLQLAIADAGDHILDSAVFIQAGTLSDTVTPVSAPGSIALLGMGLLGLGLSRKRKGAKA